MIKFERTKVYNIANAVYSARNPMNSWDKSDSDLEKDIVGPKDMEMAMKLIKAGDPSHRKFLRQIFVSVDITAPLYWWKEADQYRIAVTTNSCSTMHKIHSKQIELSDFSFEDFYIDDEGIDVKDCFINTVADCEMLRKKYLETKEKRYWRALIQLLPESYNQKRTITMNYENILSMVHQRKNHKLSEWSEGFISWARTLPYAQEFIFFDEEHAKPNPVDEEILALWNSGMGKKRISQKCHVTTEYVAQVIGGK